MLFLLLACTGEGKGVRDADSHRPDSGGDSATDSDTDTALADDTGPADDTADSGDTGALPDGFPNATSAWAVWTGPDDTNLSSALPVQRALDLSGDGVTDLLTSALAGVPDHMARVNVHTSYDAGTSPTSDTPLGVLLSRRAGDPYGIPSLDADGDGLADLLCSEGAFGEVEDPNGQVYLFPGPLDGEREAEDATWSATGTPDETNFGWSVDAVDRDGDGVEEVYAIELWSSRITGFDATVRGVVAEADANVLIDASWDGAETLLGMGDLSGDGTADIAIAAGSALVLVSGAPASGTLAELTTAQVDIGNGWSYSIHADCDVDGDGRVDLLVGYQDSTLGAVLGLWSGPLAGSLTLADAAWRGQPSFNTAPIAAICAGDQDGDGGTDLLVNMESTETTSGRVGAVMLLTGPFAGDTWNLDGPRIFGAPDQLDFGEGLALTPDLDADGAPDFATSARDSATSDHEIDVIVSSTWTSGADER